MSEYAANLPQPIAIAVVEHAGRFLIRQRPEGAPLAGYWEFPGGKQRPDETPEAAAVRECLEETGLAVRIVGLLIEVVHRYDHGTLRLSFEHCACVDPAAPPQGGYVWVDGNSLDNYAFPPANDQVLQRIRSGAVR